MMNEMMNGLFAIDEAVRSEMMSMNRVCMVYTLVSACDARGADRPL